MKTLALAIAKGKIAPVGRQFLRNNDLQIKSKLNQDSNDRKKGGRPKKSPVTRKDKTIAVCFSEPELYAIRHRAAKANLPLSVYCHDAILDGVIKEPFKKRNWKRFEASPIWGTT